MRPISTESVSAGAAPMLQWLKITDLVVDPAYQRPIIGKDGKMSTASAGHQSLRDK